MSVKIKLRETHQKKDGTFPIIIQVIHDREVKIITTGYSVKANQFREVQDSWVYRHPDAILINSAIEAKRAGIIKKAVEAEINGQPFDDSKKVDTFYKAVMNMLTQYEKRNQVAAYTRLKTNLDFLKDAWGKDVRLEQLNKEWVNKYINYRYEKKNSANTIKKNLQDLAVCLNVLDHYEGKNWFYLASKTITPKPVRRDALPEQEIKMLEKVKLTGMADIARNMWLFSYYAQGMRFESVALQLRAEIKNGIIRYRMNKGQKIREIVIHEKLKKIIDKYKGRSIYLFPVIKITPDPWNKKAIVGSANTMIRAFLNQAAIIAGIDRHMIFHQARHSYATMAMKKGLSYSILKDSLGHTNYATTVNYLNSLTDARINDAIKESGLFD